MSWAAYIWLGFLLTFLVVEAVCAIHLVCLWFAVGALGAMLVAILGGATWLQVSVFLVISGILLALLWPLTRKFLNPAHTATNVDSVIGSIGLVTAPIDNLSAQGQVKLGAMYWTARSTGGDPIAEGTTIRVDRIEGVKVFVTPVQIPVSQ